MNIIPVPPRITVMGSYELQLIREHKLQQRLFSAEAEMLAAIDEVNRLSAFQKIDRESFTNFAHDHFPTLESWNEKIKEVDHA